MPAGIVLAGGRSSRMGTPKAWLDWHGTTLLRRACGIVARGAAGPVVVVRAPGQELPPLPAGVRVVEDAREGRGPLQGILAGLEAVDAERRVRRVGRLPFLHPRFVAAVCAAARRGRRRGPVRRRLPPAARGRVPARAGAAGRRARRRRPDEARVPVRALRDALAGGAAAPRERAQPQRAGRLRGGARGAGAARARALLRPARAAATEVRAATLGAAAAAVGVELGEHVLAAINGDQVARDPLEPLAEGDDVAFMAADAGG